MANFAFSFQKYLTMHHMGAVAAHLKEVSVVAEDIELTHYKT